MTDEIQLTLPAQEDFRHVAHLVVGGLAARRELTYEDLEDLQVAFDAVLACREDDDDIVVSLRVDDGNLHASIGPFTPDAVAQLDREPGGLPLRRVLDTVCDSVSVDERDGGTWVVLSKQVKH
jgi:anti-sigma regulatory factor (Ser/Thr protein kinase)